MSIQGPNSGAVSSKNPLYKKAEKTTSLKEEVSKSPDPKKKTVPHSPLGPKSTSFLGGIMSVLGGIMSVLGGIGSTVGSWGFWVITKAKIAVVGGREAAETAEQKQLRLNMGKDLGEYLAEETLMSSMLKELSQENFQPAKFFTTYGKDFCGYTFTLHKKEKNWPLLHKVLQWMDSPSIEVRQEYLQKNEVFSSLFSDLFSSRDPKAREYAQKWIREGGAPLLEAWAKGLRGLGTSFGKRLEGLSFTLDKPGVDKEASKEKARALKLEKNKLSEELKEMEREGDKYKETNEKISKLNDAILEVEGPEYKQTFLENLPMEERRAWNEYVDSVPLEDKIAKNLLKFELPLETKDLGKLAEISVFDRDGMGEILRELESHP